MERHKSTGDYTFPFFSHPGATDQPSPKVKRAIGRSHTPLSPPSRTSTCLGTPSPPCSYQRTKRTGHRRISNPIEYPVPGVKYDLQNSFELVCRIRQHTQDTSIVRGQE
ncbi:hypothetical protein P691DRAFT_813427 [Macrolepiota fuliginosa MF-IS2]|uniref:Uncharacterized protein n=1 Tax=Macrolepiota fuliginosa MF-IS2 TaxID=1400762 RepID=A0A9P5WZ61_9AGAR|nr:hypothetical protein P691DRAFT_813427 [Macrolepiota fuliginosa MF-IS2]